MRSFLAGLCAALVMGACTARSEVAPAPASSPSVPPASVPTPDPSPSPSVSPSAKAEARAVGANELGVVPVVMYHRILKRPRSAYDTSPKGFLDELRTLYRSGYRPITAAALAWGDIDLPAGTSPVVLTFDDSSREQLSYTKKVRIAPRSALGMLLEFSRTHPDFPPVATLFVNRSPFGFSDPAAVLTDLYERGFELANHTSDHLDLSEVSAATAEAQLSAGARIITGAVEGAEVDTVALPYGRQPPRRSIAWRGRGYHHIGVFLVGSEPAPSPFAAAFDRHRIPRIRTGAGVYEARYWLRVIGKDPSRHYVSDGDPGVVSFPRRLQGGLGGGFEDVANPYRISPDGFPPGPAGA